MITQIYNTIAPIYRIDFSKITIKVHSAIGEIKNQSA